MQLMPQLLFMTSYDIIIAEKGIKQWHSSEARLCDRVQGSDKLLRRPSWLYSVRLSMTAFPHADYAVWMHCGRLRWPAGEAGGITQVLHACTRVQQLSHHPLPISDITCITTCTGFAPCPAPLAAENLHLMWLANHHSEAWHWCLWLQQCPNCSCLLVPVNCRLWLLSDCLSRLLWFQSMSRLTGLLDAF